MNETRLFNDGWEFTKQPIGTTNDQINRSSTEWKPVEIPHDWLIYNTSDLYETGEGWYRRKLNIQTDLTSNRIAIRFEGVYMNSTVFVNDVVAGEWKYGYSTFEFDITDLLKQGDNEIKVRVVHESPNSRWYSGAGIYRNVWLKTVPNAHLVSDGIYIAPLKQGDDWIVEVDSESIAKSNETSGTYRIKHTITDQNGAVVSTSEGQVAIRTETSIDSQSLHVQSPALWDIESPTLYTLRTELSQGDIVIQEVTQNFGFRTIEYNTDRGFFLNGRHVKMFGACQHHDLGSLGAAVNKTALRRQFKQLQEMGVNAVRTAHNMPAVELMELADEMGMLIISEAFDMWERPKTTYDYGRYFGEWAEKDVASWIRRDRNHPSVIMWSIGNEIYDTHADERGQELTRYLMELVQQHDPKGNARATIGSNYMPWENAQKCADIIKLAGYNYAEKYYHEHHRLHPDWIIYGSETSSTVQSRGIYRFPYSQSILADDDEQCSSLGNCTTSWSARSSEAVITDDRDAPFSLGTFIWTGTDYIGEPTPYHTKNSYFGQIDTAGFPKDTFYIYQSAWTDYHTKPMVHIIPMYWDFNDGQLIDVRVASNAPRVELFLNDKSLGQFDIDHAHGKQLLGHWQVPYQAGKLKAVAYDEKCQVVAEDIRQSFGNAAKIVLSPDKTELLSDGRDLIFVEVSMADKNGFPVGNANNRVHVKVEGAGRLVGLDNGDSTDYDAYKGTSRRLFSGKLIAIIAAKFDAGPIRMEVSSEGLEAEELQLKALPCERPEGIEAFTENAPSELNREVPVRKIAIVSPSGTKLNKQLTEVRVRAELSPANATYQDVEWRVSNDAGINTNIATVRADGQEAIVTALGDGAFQLRCMAKNGADKVRLISQVDFEVSELGLANLNPYEFISGGLYTDSNGEISNGNERGIATARDEETHVGFRNIDFGEYGSDELTIPIFSFDSNGIPIELWEGMPGEEGSEYITTVTYQKPTRWNTYQEETYTLPRRLKGVTTLCFVLRRKVHMKGFIFKKLDKAYRTLQATENNRIYGDTFNITADTVENIGNNVSLEFDNMNFGNDGFSRLVICGRSPIEKNTIHVRFAGEHGQVNQIAEFAYSDGYVEREFALERVTGLQKVTFVFLPGCQFDFKWFRFEK